MSLLFLFSSYKRSFSSFSSSFSLARDFSVFLDFRKPISVFIDTQSCPLVFTQMSWKFLSTEKPACDVYSSFILNFQNLEKTKMSFSRWMDK